MATRMEQNIYSPSLLGYFDYCMESIIHYNTSSLDSLTYPELKRYICRM